MSSPDIFWLIQNNPNCSIALRNLCLISSDAEEKILVPSSKVEIHFPYTDEGDTHPAILSSSLAICSSNPSWTFSGMYAPSQSHTFANLGIHNMLLKVIHCELFGVYKESTLFSEIIDLTKLIPLKVSRERHNFPVNFLLLVIEDSLYTTESMYLRLQPLSPQQFPPLSAFESIYFSIGDESKTGEVASSFLRMSESEVRLNTIREKISCIWQSDTRTVGRSNLSIASKEQKLATLRTLRNAVASAEESRSREHDQLQLEKNDLQRLGSIDLVRSLDRLSILSDELRDKNSVLEQRRIKLAKVRFLHEARQIKLLSDLHGIYPIDPGSFSHSAGDFDSHNNGPSSIRGIEVVWGGKELLSSGPGNAAMLRICSEDELLSAALCYIAHVLLLASKYLGVTLRYQIILLGSKSFIRDPGNEISTA